VTLHPLIEWLYAQRAPNIKWELDTMKVLLSLMGDPQRRLTPVLVAGTNGKGSVAAFLHAIASEAGLRPGMFTSPHLIRPEERIRLGRDDIPSHAFLERVAGMKALVESEWPGGRLPRHPSFFEMTAAMAMAAMDDAGATPAVLEVGLGGRLDATNAADPVLSVITCIGLEHTKTLGDTTAKIAGEKAGILRPGVPLVTGVTDPAALAVLQDRAAALGAPIHHLPSTCTLEPGRDETLDLETPLRRYRALRPGLAGLHQRSNAALAVRGAELLAELHGLPLSEEAIRSGLASVRWPGRLERVEGAPPFLLDGAHNPDGCQALAAHLERLRRSEPPEGPVVLLFASMGDKNVDTMLAILARGVDRVVVTRAEVQRSAEPETLLELARARFPQARMASDTDEALAAAREEAGDEGLVVVAGSLFLVGEARSRLLGIEGPGNPPRSPSHAPVPLP
jgi:dihydrofolate synthase/folylpolyglutamate synthase